MDYQQRRTTIRTHLSAGPQPKVENSELIDKITELMLQIQETGDTVALMQLARQFNFAAEQTL